MAYLAKYLPDVGWNPTVVTRAVRGNGHSEPDVIRVGRPYATTWVANNQDADRTECLHVKSLKRQVKNVVFFPDRAVGWIPFAVAAAIRAHRKRPFDAIISSAMPGSVHVVASLLEKKLGLPWLADYRDLWSGNPYADEPPWREKLLRKLEKRTLRRALRLTTITDALASSLSAVHGRNVATIPNGFDSTEWNAVPFAKPDLFRIVHAGSLYDGRRNAEPLFAQLGALRWEGVIPELRVDFYGPNPGNLIELARRNGIEDSVRYRGVIEREDVMREERSCSLLLIIQNNDPRTTSEYGSKIFEYQAAGTLILAVGPPTSVLRSYITENRLGWFASDGNEIRAALCAAYRSHLQGRNLREGFDDSGTAHTIASAFAEALNGIVSGQLSQTSDCLSTAAIGFEKKVRANLR
jgi:glycosyltransferase involved in cell wall biosynthesis